MAFTVIPPTDIDNKSPVDTGLLTALSNNDDDNKSRYEDVYASWTTLKHEFLYGSLVDSRLAPSPYAFTNNYGYALRVEGELYSGGTGGTVDGAAPSARMLPFSFVLLNGQTMTITLGHGGTVGNLGGESSILWGQGLLITTAGQDFVPWTRDPLTVRAYVEEDASSQDFLAGSGRANESGAPGCCFFTFYRAFV